MSHGCFQQRVTPHLYLIPGSKPPEPRTQAHTRSPCLTLWYKQLDISKHKKANASYMQNLKASLQTPQFILTATASCLTKATRCGQTVAEGQDASLIRTQRDVTCLHDIRAANSAVQLSNAKHAHVTSRLMRCVACRRAELRCCMRPDQNSQTSAQIPPDPVLKLKSRKM